MIVDVHYHLIPIELTPEMVKDTIYDLIRIAKIMGIETSKEILIKKACQLWSDPEGKHLVKIEDKAGIDFTVVCHHDNSDNETLTSDVTQLFNEAVSNIANKYPNQLMALAGVDPRRPDALDMLKQCFEEFGMKGLKYHPDDGFDPSGPESYVLLKYLEKKNGILLTHTDPLTGKRSKYSDPLLLSDILVDFPNLKVIAAHMGQINWRPWAALAAHHPNLYGDLAMWGPYAFGKFELFCRELRDIIDYVGVEQVLFGSDSPIFDIVLPIEDFIEKLKRLPEEAPNGIIFTKEEIDAILGGNAAKLLNLS